MGPNGSLGHQCFLCTYFPVEWNIYIQTNTFCHHEHATDHSQQEVFCQTIFFKSNLAGKIWIPSSSNAQLQILKKKHWKTAEAVNYVEIDLY